MTKSKERAEPEQKRGRPGRRSASDRLEAVRALLEGPWPTALLTVEVTDATYLEAWKPETWVRVEWQQLPAPIEA